MLLVLRTRVAHRRVVHHEPVRLALVSSPPVDVVVEVLGQRSHRRNVTGVALTRGRPARLGQMQFVGTELGHHLIPLRLQLLHGRLRTLSEERVDVDADVVHGVRERPGAVGAQPLVDALHRADGRFPHAATHAVDEADELVGRVLAEAAVAEVLVADVDGLDSPRVPRVTIADGSDLGVNAVRVVQPYAHGDTQSSGRRHVDGVHAAQLRLVRADAGEVLGDLFHVVGEDVPVDGGVVPRRVANTRAEFVGVGGGGSDRGGNGEGGGELHGDCFSSCRKLEWLGGPCV
ncbi:hypothetical protein ON010_g14477 [Phytophthora cinnamomi]|nr:hypothetical protein ON010_g14477 [Phytophthora cinnamomi]